MSAATVRLKQSTMRIAKLERILSERDDKIAELEEALRWRDKSETPEEGQLVLMVSGGWIEALEYWDVGDYASSMFENCTHWRPIQLPEAGE